MRSQLLAAECVSTVIYDVTPCSVVKWLHTLWMKVGKRLQNYTAAQPVISLSTSSEKSLPSNHIRGVLQGDRHNATELLLIIKT